eukprot:CAMPEP_0204112960 /NCGR_PEP_ID=MMETSP0361-20130328/3371_1 /ASSEMBLY_ACC=CAM_ASM_000343 /TAXON_ID=268821 /ORGANISM="Scrippsiella Hangoei, Strain SHTV-5" /LENGTH=259 /DNA_ID=CAMNT_0051063247 /DNA_START=272 /DNA_END=1052 /DNA_ORIENTATION=-
MTIELRSVHGLYGVRERHSVTCRIDTLDKTATKLTGTLVGRQCEAHCRAVGGMTDVAEALPALHAAVLEPPCIEVAVVRSLPTVARLAKLAFELLCTKGHESRLQVAVHSNGASEFPKANTTATVRFLSLPTGIPVHVFCAGLDVGVGVGEGGANEGKLEGRIWWRIKDVISIGSAAQNWQPLPLVLARLGASATGTIRATTAAGDRSAASQATFGTGRSHVSAGESRVLGLPRLQPLDGAAAPALDMVGNESDALCGA